MTPTHKPTALVALEVPLVGQNLRNGESITLHPKVIELTWERNPPNVADTLRLVLGWDDGGCDPRLLSHAVCKLWLYDANREDFDDAKHLRFVGCVDTPARKASDGGMTAEIACRDYTALFLDAKPYPASGQCSWDMTLADAWRTICQHTGWADVERGEIVSSVDALADRLVFDLSDPSRADAKLGEMVPQRLWSISRPVPRHGASAWDYWQDLVSGVGLMSYIDRDRCIVTDTSAHYREEGAAIMVMGHDVLSIEETHETHEAHKGLLLTSYDPLTGRQLEAFYPPPGDERLQQPRAGTRGVRRAQEHYDRQIYNAVVDQATLQRRCKEAWGIRSRQALHGKLTTAEMTLATRDGRVVDLLDLQAGDPIEIALADNVAELDKLPGDTERVRYLVDQAGYDEDVARLIVANRGAGFAPLFNVSAVRIHLGPQKYEAEVDYHARVSLRGQ